MLGMAGLIGKTLLLCLRCGFPAGMRRGLAVRVDEGGIRLGGCMSGRASGFFVAAAPTVVSSAPRARRQKTPSLRRPVCWRCARIPSRHVNSDFYLPA
jgi:hypothetical protein